VSKLVEHNSDFIKLLSSGDMAAYQELYECYYKDLCRFAFRFIENREDSEDLVQETLLKVWEQRAKLVALMSIKSYLYSAVKNSCLNYLGHQKVVQKHADAVANEINSLSLGQTQTDFDDEREFLETKLYESIEELPAQCREIFKQKYIDGLKTKEIAEKTGLSPRTVEAHVFNALKALREKMKFVAPVLLFLLIHNLLKNF
jgi:RNA polymerase sigma-70 factor (ECF subfamily)